MVTALILTVAALSSHGQQQDGPKDDVAQPHAKQNQVVFRINAIDEGRTYRVFAYYANVSKEPVRIVEPGRNHCTFEYQERWRDATGTVVKVKADEAEYYPGGLNASIPESSLATLPRDAILGQSFSIFRAKCKHAESEIWIRCRHLAGVTGRNGENWGYAFESPWCLVERAENLTAWLGMQTAIFLQSPRICNLMLSL